MAVVRRYRATEPAHFEPIEWWLQDAYFEVSDLRLAGRVLEIPMQRHPADEGPFPSGPSSGRAGSSATTRSTRQPIPASAST